MLRCDCNHVEVSSLSIYLHALQPLLHPPAPLTFQYKLVYTHGLLDIKLSESLIETSSTTFLSPSAGECGWAAWFSAALSLADPPRKNSSHLDVRPAGAERSREGAPNGRRWRRRRRRRLPLFHYRAPCYRTAKLWEGVKKEPLSLLVRCWS